MVGEDQEDVRRAFWRPNFLWEVQGGVFHDTANVAFERLFRPGQNFLPVRESGRRGYQCQQQAYS